MKRTALLSVYHKDGLVEFARELVDLGWSLLSSGGTYRHLTAAGIPITSVEEYRTEALKKRFEAADDKQDRPTLGLYQIEWAAKVAGQAEMLDHRVATLHAEVHGGLLASLEMADELEALGMNRIDLVCVDLYPLEDEIEKEGSTRESVIKQTDIGGPTMIRSGAKGRRYVVCDPADRIRVIDHLKANEPDSEEFVRQLVAKAEFTISNYCLVSAKYHGPEEYDGILGTKVRDCAYGENAWQSPAAHYSVGSEDPLALEKFTLLHGTPPSYNNMCDIDRLLQTITHMAAGIDVNNRNVFALAVGAKHGNPCGAAIGLPIEAIKRMVEGDTRAIFGGLVITNFALDEELAEVLLTHAHTDSPRRLLDGVICPSITRPALDMLKRKGDKCRFLVNRALGDLGLASLDQARRFRYVRGGFLVQPNYTYVLDLQSDDIEKIDELTWEQETDMVLAWAVGSTSNSNTITIVKHGRLLANAVGQQDRVGAVELSGMRAKNAGHLADIRGSVAYSDSFFTFPDAPQALYDAGVAAVLTSSGSIRDADTKKVFAGTGVALRLIPDRMGRGFFGH